MHTDDQFLTLWMLTKSADFFKIHFLSKIFQEHYHTFKQFLPRSGPTFCQSLSGFKLFERIISRHTLSEASEVWQSYLKYKIKLEKWKSTDLNSCILK